MVEEEEEDGKKPALALTGSSVYSDPYKVILKRIILTGYPIRTKKKSAIIKFMFFNPQDVHHYFKNELYSKNGLKGKIKQSVGTHGSYKVIFNNHLKQNDTVCMNLYKRIYPQFMH